MPFTFNGNVPKEITYNGNTVEKLTYNGVTVWERKKEFVLASARTNSILTMYSSATATTSTGSSVPASSLFFLLSQTATNGRVPIIYDGGLYWVSSSYPQVCHSFSVYTNSMVLLNNPGNSSSYKSIYASRSDTSEELGYYNNYPFFEVYESTPVSGYYSARYDTVKGYIKTSSYLSDVIDLSQFDLSDIV